MTDDDRGLWMDDWKTVQRLRLLLRFDTQSALVCSRAREGIAGSEFRDALESIGHDHDRQIEELRKVVSLARSEDPGGGPADESPDAKQLETALSALDARISDQTRIRACLQWEGHAAEGYAEALREKHHPDIRSIFERHRSAELVHIASLQALLKKE